VRFFVGVATLMSTQRRFIRCAVIALVTLERFFAWNKKRSAQTMYECWWDLVFTHMLPQKMFSDHFHVSRCMPLITPQEPNRYKHKATLPRKRRKTLPVWSLLCIMSDSFRRVEWPHKSHTNGLMSVWISMCLTKFRLFDNSFLQILALQWDFQNCDKQLR